MPMSFSKSCTLIAILFFYVKSYSQSSIGAPFEAIGNATSTMKGIWSTSHNPAGISKSNQLSAGISYRTIQNIEGFNTAALAIAIPFKIGAFGIGISRLGDLLYNEQRFGLSYGNSFGITDLGIKIAYHQYHFEGFGNKAVPVISFGGITRLSNQFFIGAFIENINQAKISDFQDERIPTIMQVGISYRPLESIAVNIDMQKDIDFEASVLIGISYAVIDNLVLKTGFNTKPTRQYFGLDFIPNNIKGIISYSLSRQKLLGPSHQVSIQYDLK